MTNARQWLSEKYPLGQREQIREIDNSYGEGLMGNLIIENFPNLEKISLASNRNITTLVICGCPLVKEIDISNNRLTTLEISELVNLEYLHVGNNQLREIDFGQNVKLKSLLCFRNPQLRKENIRGLEKLTQLKLLDCDENLLPMVGLKEFYEARIGMTRVERDEALESLQNEQIAHRETYAKFINSNEIIINAQHELGINHLSNLPLIPEGETLYTLLQRPLPEQLEQVQNELEIERDHALDIDRWYRRIINDELGNELLQSLYENQAKSKLVKKLEIENEILKQIAEMEIKDNLELFTKIQDKKKELKELKVDIKDKLENDNQRIFLTNFLTSQEQLVYLENANQQACLPSERQLQRAKQKLSSWLREEEIDVLGKLQTELTKLEITLEKVKEDKLEARIEDRRPPYLRN